MRIDIYTRTMLDDRGARRPVFTGLKRLWSKSERCRISAGDMEAMRQALAAKDGLTLLFLGLCTAMVAYGVLDGGRDIVSGLRVVALLVLVYLIGYQVRLRRLPTRNAKKIRFALVSLGRCPSCASQLPQLPDLDGCFVCAHCEGAWQPILMRETCVCGYALGGLESGDGKLIRCPECGRFYQGIPVSQAL
jgi:hypothetical protein